MVYKAYRQEPKPEKPAYEADTCVYDIVLNGEVVYVGMTNNPTNRMLQHNYRGTVPKGSRLIVHKWYSTRDEAKREEYSRQMELKPVHCCESYKYDSDGYSLSRCVVEGSRDRYETISMNDPDRYERLAEQERLRATGKVVYLKPWKP